MPLPPASAPDLTPALPCQPAADHLVIPWAVSLAEPCQQALATLDAPAALPELHALLGALTEQHWLRGDEYQPATPHERALAGTVGWPTGEPADSSLDTAAVQAPWAALWAHQDGLPAAPGEAWGLMTPTHWLMGRDQLTLLHPDELALTEAESRTLFEAVHPLFDSEGWHMVWGAPTRWYLRHPTLAGLPTASLDRVIGRNPDLWMPDQPEARLLRRLQNEVQMLLYQHPANDEREARRALTVNSFWLSGTGTAPTAQPSWPAWPLQVAQGPRQALLRDDLTAWRAAWDTLDSGALRALHQAHQAGRHVRLTLCGERHALTLSAPQQRAGLWSTLARALPWGKTAPRAAELLGQL